MGVVFLSRLVFFFNRLVCTFCLNINLCRREREEGVSSINALNRKRGPGWGAGRGGKKMWGGETREGREDTVCAMVHVSPKEQGVGISVE